MTRINALVSNFTAGEFSPRLDQRLDVEKYNNAAQEITNFLVVPHGGVKKRPGTQFVTDLVNSTDAVRLVPFEYNTEQAYVLLFGPGFIWFLRDGGIITHDPVSISNITATNPPMVVAPSHGFVEGSRVLITGVAGMSEINNRHYRAVNVTPDNFELQGVDASSYTAYSSGGQAGRLVELQTSFTASQVPDLSWAQSADVLYVAHKDHSPKKITRTSHTNWTFSDFAAEKGPFRQINPDDTHTMTFSNWSASPTAYGTYNVGETATMTSSQAIFEAGHVGALWRLKETGNGDSGLLSAPVGDSTKAISVGQTYTKEDKAYGVAALSGLSNWQTITRVPAHESGTVRVNVGANYFDAAYLHNLYCIVKILAVTSDTTATVQIVYNHMPESIVDSGTAFWEEGSWSDYRGWPSEVEFYEQRLFFAGNTGEPQTIWGSRSATFEDFEDGAEDDDAVVYALSSGRVDAIKWLASGRVLTAGTSSGEYAIAPSENGAALSPSNVRASMQTAWGTGACNPITIGQTVLYPQRHGDPDNLPRKLREYTYAFDQDAYQSVDLTVFSEHITGDGLSELAHQLEPDNMLWAIRADGYAVAMTYERDQNVVGWHKHFTRNGSYLHMAAIPGDYGEDLYLIVERTINGQTVRYIEVTQPYLGEDADEKNDAWFLDCALKYDGAATSTLGGLSHLEGETVQILADGSVQSDKVVTNGRITLDIPATKVLVGYGITSTLTTMSLVQGAQQGTGAARQRHVAKVFVRLLSSQGGEAADDSLDYAEIDYREPSHPMDTSPPLFTGWKEIPIAGTHSRDKHVTVRHTEPLPFFMTSLVAEMVTK